MNSYNNYMNYIEPPKKTILYKKTPTKLIQNNNYNRTNLNGSGLNINQIKARATKLISDQRYRGELDISSPGNKNVLLDSDSELTTNSKNLNPNTGCTKLVIEKIESQIPQINKEYYKFTNLKRELDDDNDIQDLLFSKKNYATKRLARCNSNLMENDRINDRDYLYFKYNNYNIPQRTDFIMNNNNIKKEHTNSLTKRYRRSTNNVPNTKRSKQYNLSNKKLSNENNNNSAFIKGRETTTKYTYHYINNDNNDIVKDNGYNRYYVDEKPNDAIYYKIMKNNYARKNKDININPQRNTLYENYQDLIKLNTFNRISQYNRGFNIRRKYNKIYNYPGFNKKLIKIQSFWRGTYVRILMGFYWNLVEFKNTLENIFRNHMRDYFLNLMQNVNNTSQIENLDEINNKNLDNKKEEKTLNEYKIAYEQKEEDYENLLKNYNALVERCTELQDLLDKSKSDRIKNLSSSKKSEKDNNFFKEKILDIQKHEINFLGNNNIDEKTNWDKLKIENNNINLEIIIDNKNIEPNNNENKDKEEIIINKIEENKKFDIIIIEQKDTFDIINRKENKDKIEIKQEQEIENKENPNNKNLRAKYKKIKKDIYQNYLDSFTSSLCIINAEHLMIEKTQKNKEIIPLKISKFQIPLINDKEIKVIEKINIPLKISKFEIPLLNDKEIKIEEKKYIPLEISKIEIPLLNNNEVKIPQKNDFPLKISKFEIPLLNDKEIKTIEKKDIPLEIFKFEIPPINGKKIKTIEKKDIPLEIFKFEIPILNDKEINEIKKPKIFDLEVIEKINENELSIMEKKKKKKRHKKIDSNENIKNQNIIKENNLVKENQKDMNIEFKGMDLNFKNNKEEKERINSMNKVEQFEIINKLINQNPKTFDKELIYKINDNELSILGIKKKFKKIKKHKKKKEKNNLMEENPKDLNNENTLKEPNMNTESKEDMIIDKNNSFSIEQQKSKIKEIDLYSPITNSKESIENKYENVNQFSIEGEKKIKLRDKNKNKTKVNPNIKNEFVTIKIIPAINNNLFIKKKKIKTCEKMTEITEDLNLILPCNNYELFIEKIINKIIYVNNNEQQLSFIKDPLDNTNKKIYKNIYLEINKENALEINPLIIKNTPEITKENEMQILYNKYAIFTQKARKNMIKMILPIKIKVTLRQFIHRNIFPLLIKQLKEIAKLKLI